MKLKKIASMMLAGVMAVSMLTACGQGNKAPVDDGTETPDVTPTSTTASVLREKLGGEARRNVTAVADADLDAALQEAVDTYYNVALYKLAVNNINIKNDSRWLSNTELGKAVIGDNLFEIEDLTEDDVMDKTAVEVYVVNKSVSDAYLLEQLAKKIDGYCGDKTLPARSDDQEYDFDYEIAASIVSVDGFNTTIDSGLKFVAFSITKNATKYV